MSSPDQDPWCGMVDAISRSAHVLHRVTADGHEVSICGRSAAKTYATSGYQVEPFESPIPDPEIFPRHTGEE